SQGGTLAQLRPAGNFLNLRSIGPQRVLILLDGVRMSPSNYQGMVNVDEIPQLLIKRVDVVTAGASAAYGADAISGTVNFQLDHDLEGVKGLIQGGMAQRGDNRNYRVGLAGGHSFNDRTHVEVSIDNSWTQGVKRTSRPVGGDDPYTRHTFVGVPGGT